jgi:threonine synthase
LEEETTILVATSGDTGAAVAGAFHGRPGFRVVILYPDGRVSPRQAHQLGAFGGNVETYRVSGTFDDCQAMVKAAFQAPRARTGRKLASANSISLGRLLPQMTYYADAALSCAARSNEGAHETSFVIPTGNLGNAFAAWMARALSTDTGRRLPIGTLTLATNANRMLVDYVASGEVAPAATIATLANAMDVGAPSNLERLRHFASDRAGIAAVSVDDAAIAQTIATVFRETGYAICPHTACAVAAAPADFNGVLVATAHPAKFDTIVTPICGPVAVPAGLAELLARDAHAAPLAASADALLDALRG